MSTNNNSMIPTYYTRAEDDKVLKFIDSLNLGLYDYEVLVEALLPVFKEEFGNEFGSVRTFRAKAEGWLNDQVQRAVRYGYLDQVDVRIIVYEDPKDPKNSIVGFK